MGGAAKEAIDFETALSGIQQKAGATDEAMVGVRKQIEAIAQDENVGASMEDILGGFERAAAAGIPIDELSEFVRIVAKGAPALDMTGEALGDTLSKLDGAGLVAREGAQRFLDSTNALEDAGTSNASDILDFMLRAGAAGKIFGLAAEDSAALGAAMVDLGINSSMAGTAINSIMTKLTSPDGLSEKGRHAFGQLYESTDEWRKLVAEDADEAFVNLLERMSELDKESRATVATDVFGLEHSDIVQRLIEGIDVLRARLGLAKEESSWIGNLDKTAALKMKTTQAQLDVVARRLKMLAINAGELALPGIDAAIAATNRMLDNLHVLRDNFDMPGLEQAKDSISELISRIEDLMGMSPSSSSIEQGFRDIANAANQVVGVVDAVATELIKIHAFASDPAGYLADPERAVEAQQYRHIPFVRQPEEYIGPRPPEARSEVTVERLGGLISPRKDSIADDVLGYVDAFSEWADGRNEEKNERIRAELSGDDFLTEDRAELDRLERGDDSTRTPDPNVSEPAPSPPAPALAPPTVADQTIALPEVVVRGVPEAPVSRPAEPAPDDLRGTAGPVPVEIINLPEVPVGEQSLASSPPPLPTSPPPAASPPPMPQEPIGSFTPGALAYKDLLVQQEAARAEATLDLDITSFMANIGAAEAARADAERPIYTDASLNVTAFLAGLNTMKSAARAAVADINSTLGGIRSPSVGGRGGNSNEYGAARRGQFAPTNLGGGT